VASDAVVALAFVMGGGFTDLHVKSMQFDLDPVEQKRQLKIAQAWASAHEAHPGDTIQITVLLQGEDGFEMTRTVDYHIPVGEPAGSLNFTISDANTINAPEFAGIAQSQLRTATELVNAINQFRGAEAAYVRVWRQEPAFNIAGPLPNGELTDPPPSVMLVLADPSASTSSNVSNLQTRGSQVAEMRIPVPGYVVSGARIVQVEVGQ
jgi:hypothetical protein